jgi:hypothetical protein
MSSPAHRRCKTRARAGGVPEPEPGFLVRAPRARAVVRGRSAQRCADLLRVDLRDAHEESCGQAQRVFLLRLLDCLDALCARSHPPHRLGVTRSALLIMTQAPRRRSSARGGAGAGRHARARRLTGNVKLLDHLLVHAHVVRHLPQARQRRLAAAAEELRRIEHCTRRALGGRARGGLVRSEWWGLRCAESLSVVPVAPSLRSDRV